MLSYPKTMYVVAQSPEHEKAIDAVVNDPHYVYVPVEYPKAVGNVLVTSAEHEAAVTGKAGPADKAPSKSVLDGTVPDVAEYVATVDDVQALKALRSQEQNGKDRQGVLDVIDGRILELKEKK